MAARGDLNACLNAHGLYNPFQFVLRLSPEVHRKIAALPSGIVSSNIDFDGLRAFSTYFHETIHWWQHIGSTAGFLLSLSYPAQTHANYKHLRNLLNLIGPKKSVRRLIEAMPGGGGPDSPSGLANIIVNNYYDIDFFRSLVTDPSAVPKIVNDPLFNWVGHCYEIAYSNILALVARSVDRDFSVLPDPRGWESEFAKLRDRNEEGYFLGSDVRIAPIGTREIFEGQARFTQLQYLYFASRGRLSWDDIRGRNMLTKVYIEAFETFLRLTHLEWPPTVDHPTVGLFLLVCDVAINPGAGFPMPLRFFEAFIDDVNPGMRFLFLCRTLAKEHPHFSKAVTEYSRDEYLEITEALSRSLILDSPFTIGTRVAEWVDEGEGFRSLMSSHATFDYAPENLPVTLLLSHFVAFNIDKVARPEFFCWPGVWMATERVSAEIGVLFDRHSALFVDKQDDDGIFPRILAGRDEHLVSKAFQTFYEFGVTYDMTEQWIASPGPFSYDYRWLSQSATNADCKRFADSGFERAYGISPDSFELV